MKKLVTLTAVGLVLLAATFAGAVEGIIWEGTDSSPALRGYNLSTSVIEVVIPAGDSDAVYVLVGNTSNALDWSGDIDTMAEVMTNLASVLDANGNFALRLDGDMSLAADSTDDELLDSTDVLLDPGEWKEIALWDTSTALFYSGYLIQNTFDGGFGGRKVLTDIFGSFAGTSNLTIRIYQNRTEKFEAQIVSPLYRAPGFAGVTAVTNLVDEVTPGELWGNTSLKLDFPIGPSDNTMVRITRATTATTGGIGLKIKQDE